MFGIALAAIVVYPGIKSAKDSSIQKNESLCFLVRSSISLIAADFPVGLLGCPMNINFLPVDTSIILLSLSILRVKSVFSPSSRNEVFIVPEDFSYSL